MMTSTVVSTAEPTLHLSLKPNHRSCKTPLAGGDFPSVSFTSHVSKSRISIRTPRARSTARIKAFYGPAETRETLYELLGITETESSFSDIKKAYKQMARLYHPDVSPPDQVDENTRRFIMVHEAYETLSNPQTRALYDRYLDAGFGFSFSARKSHQETEERGEWRRMWESQLDELRRRDFNGGMSWGARMRSKR
ncbi:hypothetical protein ACS0TY_020512 [Phlomoides rotata]